MHGGAQPAIGVQAAGPSKPSWMNFWAPKSMQDAPRGPEIYRPAFVDLTSTTSTGGTWVLYVAYFGLPDFEFAARYSLRLNT